MAGDSPSKWSDAELTSAVAASTSWRGLMRALSLPETSPQMILRVKQDVARLGLATSHFTTPRTWSGGELKCAIAAAQSTDELLHSLGLQPGSDEAWTRVKANAIRLGLDLSQLESTIDVSEPADQRPELGNLRLIPSQVIAGRVMILLRTYPQYIVGNAVGLMASRPNAAPGALSTLDRDRARS
ncbi:MAG: hypothetical protein ABSA02_31465 [Trebonia sp.]